MIAMETWEGGIATMTLLMRCRGNLKGVSRIVRFISGTHGHVEQLHAHCAREM